MIVPAGRSCCLPANRRWRPHAHAQLQTAPDHGGFIQFDLRYACIGATSILVFLDRAVPKSRVMVCSNLVGAAPSRTAMERAWALSPSASAKVIAAGPMAQDCRSHFTQVVRFRNRAHQAGRRPYVPSAAHGSGRRYNHQWLPVWAAEEHRTRMTNFRRHGIRILWQAQMFRCQPVDQWDRVFKIIDHMIAPWSFQLAAAYWRGASWRGDRQSPSRP